jgi:hypothetical protein
MDFVSDIFGSPSPPPTPDYTGAARAQGAANVETARLEGRMNRPDVFSPYDQTLVTDLGDDRFAMNYSLTPEYERQRVKQAGIGEQYLDTAASRLNELPTGQLNLSSLPSFQGAVDRTGFAPLATMNDLSDYATRSEGAYYDRAMSRLQPSMDMQRTSLHTDLINSGLPVGSEAYNNSMAQLGLQQNDQMQGLAQSSIAEGQRMRQGLAGEAQSMRQSQLAEASMMREMQNQARAQGLADTLLERRLPMEELATLTGSPSIGSAGMGTATTGLNVPGVSIAPPPIMQAAGMAGSDANNRYASEMQGYGARMNMLGNIAGAGASAYGASDKTLKENIVKVGQSPSGFNIYEWNYLWSPERFRGVIAQEVQKIKPKAVLSNIFGHLMVDYSKLDVNMERI